MRLMFMLALIWVVGTATNAIASDIGIGKAKADANCAVCHGVQGLSTLPDAPNLAGQPEIYLAAQLKNYRSGKRAHEVMSVIAKPLSDQDIDNLSAWYASLRIKVQEGK